MNISKIWFLVLFSLVLRAGARPLLVIADIDDTLKVAHVLNWKEAVANAPRSGNVFRGMPELLKIVKLSQPQSSFYYVSNAPESLMGHFHRAFVQSHGLPSDGVILRSKYSAEEHKVRTIRELILKERPSVILAFGDNGEMDVYTYERIHNEFPQIPMVTFVRLAYYSKANDQRGKELRNNQMGFVSPVEIALYLAQTKVIPMNGAAEIMRRYISPTLNSARYEDREGASGILSFPYWQDCRDFTWPEGVGVPSGFEAGIDQLRQRISSRCGIRPQNK